LHEAEKPEKTIGRMYGVYICKYPGKTYIRPVKIGLIEAYWTGYMSPATLTL
jgi:hypothetical protein